MLLEQAQAKCDDPQYLQLVQDMVQLRTKVDASDVEFFEGLIALSIKYAELIEANHSSMEGFVDYYGVTDCVRYANYYKGRARITPEISAKWGETPEQTVQYIGVDAVIALASATDSTNLPLAVEYLHDSVTARQGIKPRGKQTYDLLLKARAKEVIPSSTRSVRKVKAIEAELDNERAKARAAEHRASAAEKEVVALKGSILPAPQVGGSELEAIEHEIAVTEQRLKVLRARRRELLAQQVVAAE